MSRSRTTVRESADASTSGPGLNILRETHKSNKAKKAAKEEARQQKLKEKKKKTKKKKKKKKKIEGDRMRYNG